jgi:glycerophosphoryl diester phosphodiesterase
MRIKVHGHRGARARRPENTVPAFRYAIDLGVDAVELDVLVTKDDVPVVLHDPCIGEPPIAVRDMTLAELRQYDVGAPKNPRFPEQQSVPGTRVPTLDEVFALSRGNKIWFNVEAKSFPDRPELTPDPQPFTRLILDLVRQHSLASRVIVQSFDPRITRTAAMLEPAVRRSALWETEREWPEVASEFAVNMLGPRHDFVTPERVAWAHAAGFEVAPWTVNRPEDWARMVIAGVDAIITDDPAALMAWLKTKRPGEIGRAD